MGPDRLPGSIARQCNPAALRSIDSRALYRGNHAF